jgi:hypothetical protein
VLEITLVMQGIEVDMVVPKQVTFGRLRSLLRSVFLEHGNAFRKYLSKDSGQNSPFKRFGLVE